MPLALLALLRRRRQKDSGRGTALRGGSLALLAMLVTVPARAQGVDLQQYKPAPGSHDMLGLAAVVSLPTADGQRFYGTGGVGVQPMLLAQWASSEQLKLLANVGARFQPARRVEVLDLNVGHELTYAMGAHWAPGNSKL